MYFKNPQTKMGTLIEFVSLTEKSHMKISLEQTEFQNKNAVAMAL
jgi:hypothetical protein